MLTCDCGASFQVPDARPGQEVSCPECHQAIKVPAQVVIPPRTSGLALASLVLALVGAFTVIGTLAAIAVGLAAFVHVARNRGRFKGFALASAGIVCGLLFTALALFGFFSGDLFGLGAKMRELSLASLEDASASPDDDLAHRGCSLKRPSELWRKVRNNRSEEPAVADLQLTRDLVLLNARRHAYLDVVVAKSSTALPLEIYANTLSKELQPRKARSAAAMGVEEEVDQFGNPREPDRPEVEPTVVSARALDPIPGQQAELEGREIVLDARRGGQPWRFVTWVYRRRDAQALLGQDKVDAYVVRAYTPLRRWEENKDELYEALKGFRVGTGP